MTEKNAMAKLICSKVVYGEETLLNLTTVYGAVPLLVKTTPGIGKPFWYWTAIPPGRLIAADFTGAPIATGDSATNKALMDAITTRPEDVIVFDPPLPPTTDTPPTSDSP